MTDLAPAAFDDFFRAQHASALLPALWAEAWGDEYPAEVQPFSPCTWTLLGLLVTRLRPAPGSTLVDLGCGRGGPGLWVARATAGRLIGVDWSAAAVQIATERAADWLAPGSYEGKVATFADTGLADGVADAVLSVDAVALAPEPHAALTEARRILAPGGRFTFTASEHTGGEPAWPDALEAAGLRVEAVDEVPGVPAALARLYALLRSRAADLRDDLNPVATDQLLAEAATVEPVLDELTWVLYAARRA